jgi:exopolyphosphatase/guanosine-5'-triphosphate,3'-diphosphate pyrophosphatase
MTIKKESDDRSALTSYEAAAAVMDLGTNTFHLLIADGTPQNFVKIAHQEIAVKLGEGGISKGYINEAAFERGLKAMDRFRELIAENHITQVKAVATSALRNASNGRKFIDCVRANTGINIELISGDEEAAYIYNGVKASGCLGDRNNLIMDIGGGSIEFILGTHENIIWKQSFEIGAQRMMDRFHHTDPIPAASVEALNVYLDEVLPNLLNAVKDHPVEHLIGSSGAFETFAELIERQKDNSFDLQSIKCYRFDLEDLLGITDKLIESSHHERLGTPGIIPVRIDMIVVASIITRYIVQKLGIKEVSMSTYSLKEGLLAEILDPNKA